MKKFMCVLILVAFMGSMVVMTGCGGGSGFSIVAGILTIAIIASATGGAAPVAFAANTRGAERPALIAQSTKRRFLAKIKPYGQAEQEAAVTVNSAGNLELEQSITANSSNGQYAVEIYPVDETTDAAMDEPIYKHYFVQSVGGGTTETYPPAAEKTRNIASDTAKALIYDKWSETETDIPTIDKTLIDLTDIASLAKEINEDLSDIATDSSGKALPYSSTNWTGWSADVDNYVIQTTPQKMYTISGYITAADGSGQTDASICACSADNSYSTHSSSGVYSVNVLPGTYDVTPYKADHTYTPASRSVEITNADVGSVNFQASSSTYPGHEEM